MIPARTTFTIDNAKVVSTAQDVAMSVQIEATKPAAIAVAQAVEQELTVAGLKIDMGLGKIMRPALEMAYNELEFMSPPDECKVHKYYQCLVDNGIAAEPWMAYQTTCE